MGLKEAITQLEIIATNDIRSGGITWFYIYATAENVKIATMIVT